MASKSQAEELTALAKIYSHPLHGRNPYLKEGALKMNHTVLQNDPQLKSGLTPIYPEDFLTDAEKVRFSVLSQYQRHRFDAFTTAELHKSEAFAPLKADGQFAFLAEVPIHPLLEQARWLELLPLHLAPVPLGNGRKGFWEASNQVVWDAMVPAIKLASKLLTQPESSLWWHALLFGDYEEIPEDELDWDGETPEIRERFRWNQALTTQHPDIHSKVQRQLEKLNQVIDFRIANGMMMDPPNILGGYNASGQTIPQSAQERITVDITRELIEPLLNDKITTAERLLCIFVLAVTMIHELAHAVWNTIKDEHASELEPYFEDEAVCELGFSLQKAIWNSIEHPILGTNRANAIGLPHAALNSYNWPSFQDEDGYNSPLLKIKPKDWDITTYVPINLDYFFDVNCLEFWKTYVRKNDPSSIHFGSKYWGIRYDRIKQSETVGYAKKAVEEKDDIIIDASKMTEAEIVRARREDARRIRGREIIRQISTLRAKAQKVEAGVTDPSDGYSLRSAFLSNGNTLLPTPPCPRFNEIRQFLFVTRSTLAWDSLHFRIPDYVLYAYIKRDGGLQIDFEEWRDFLITCNNTKTLFHFEYVGSAPTPLLGMVSRNDRGWGMTALPIKLYPTPSPLTRMTYIRALILLKEDEVGGGFTDQKLFCDFDKDLLRRKANELLAENPYSDVNGNLVIGNLSVDDFDQCIAMPKPVGRQDFIFGPPGIIRKHKNTTMFG
ncbi:hypothetical protein BDZ45DRAFT_471392 [Acephala macrosclerotiorum]|nr:hypothetical protein BDZ45DRAFT_471392 [Acephala macrosclerotiorum]